MVTLLLGAYGHGKSTHIMNEIKRDYENKKRAYLIVPEQQTLDAERQLCQSLPPASQFFIEATNLTRLSDSVFRQAGGLRYNYVSKSGKNLIMYRTLCEVRDTLTKYEIPKGKEKSCIKLFLQAIAELKTYGIGIEQLEEAATKVNGEELKARLCDIITIWACYEKLLHQMYDDPLDNLLMLEKKLGECAFFKDTNVYIDSFYGFTASQLNVIARIIEGADNVTIALDCPNDADENTMQYARIASTKSKLLARCRKISNADVQVIKFDTDYKHKSKELEYICDNLWSFNAPAIKPHGNVRLALAANEFEECEYVCSKIKELILSGERYGEIAIIARNTSTYQGIIDYCLDKYDIPYYFSVPSKLMAKPVIKMVFSALNALNGMRGEDIVSYVKCGYTDITQEELCLFESYLYRWSIYGKKFTNDDYWNANPDGYVDKPTITQANNLLKIQDTRKKVLNKLAILEKPFISGLTVKDCAIAIYNFLEAHNIKDKLKKEIKAESAANAQELSQVWSALLSALDTLVTVCGEVKCGVDTFITLFGYAIMDTKIGTIPTGEDNVTVADASLVRAKNIKHVFVLGANEGDFPSSIDDNSFFNDSDKKALKKCEVELSAESRERGDDELLFFKNSIACASHTVTVTALKTDIRGNKKETSIGFNRIKELLSECEVLDVSALPVIDKIYTEKVACELFGATQGELKRAIANTARVKSLCGSFTNENDTVSADTAAQIFGKRLYLSKSQIEKFAKCRFDYYCSYILGIRDSSKIAFTHNDLGILIHSIFEHFLTLDKGDEQKYTSEKILETVTRLTNEYTLKVCGVRALSNKMRHFFSRIIDTVCVFVQKLLDEKEKSKFNSEYFELSINGDGFSAPLPVEFSFGDENSIVMTGVADRVDLCRKGDCTYIKIVDYKTGKYEFNVSKIEKGLDMQMLIYLFALCNMKESEFKKQLMQWTKEIKPAGFVFLSYSIDKTDQNKEVDLSSDLALKNEADAIGGKIARSGLELKDITLQSSDSSYNLKESATIDEQDFLEKFELIKAEIMKVGLDMLSGNAQAVPMDGESPCRYCKNSAICRKKVSTWEK